MSLTISVSDIINQSTSELLSKHGSWESVELGSIAKVLNGFAFSSAKFSQERGIPLIRIRDISRNFTETQYDGPYVEVYLVKPGDLLVGMDGNFNCALWTGPVGLLNQRVCKIEVYDEVFSKSFLSYVLPAYLTAINDVTSSITVKHLSSKSVEEIPLPLPPLAEQNRIVAAIEQQFSRLDAGVAALRQAQTKLKRYRAAVLKAAVKGKLTEDWRAEHSTTEPASKLLERILAERRVKWEADLRAKGKDPTKVKYVEPAKPDVESLPKLPEGWCWATVEQLASADKYSLAIGPFGSNLKVEDYQDQGVPLVFVRNIRSSVFDGPDTRYITVAKANELRAHQVVGGDILVTKMGDPPGDACLYPETRPTAIITADCIKWTLSPFLSQRRFFVNALNSYPIKMQVVGITKGVAQLKVSLGRFLGIVLSLPPLAEQEQIVAEVERRLSVVSQLEATVEANLKRAERLHQSILKEAFAGRLVPQDPNDEPASVLLERILRERDVRKSGMVDKGRTVDVTVTEPVKIEVKETRQVELWESVGGGE